MLRNHQKRHEAKQKCSTCNKMVSNLDKHQRMHKNRKFSCDVCDYKTNVSASLKKHKLTHSRTECSICHRSVASLKEHLKEVHGDKQHSCDTCSYSTRSLQTLERHKLTHNKTKCPICKKLVANVKAHMRYASGEKFPCKLCEKKFEPHKMKMHMKIVHKRISCGTCAETFNGKFDLRQ